MPETTAPYRPRVLAVDMCSGDVERLCAILTPAGYDVLPASGPCVAADLVLLDVERPVTDGVAAYRRLVAAQEGPPLPVLMLTPRVDRQARREVLEAGVDDVLTTEPLDPLELKVRVHTLLELKAHRERGGGQPWRLEEHRVPLSPTHPRDMQRFDLRELVAGVVERLRAAGRLGEAEVTVVLPEEPVSGVFHRRRLEQVLEALVSNAADAVEDVKDRPRRIHVGVEVPDAFGDFGPRLFVQDTGIGIFEDELQAIFAPYYTTKPPEKAAGLGLTVARALVEAMDGQLTVHSRINLGSTFTVELPEQTASW